MPPNFVPHRSSTARAQILGTVNIGGPNPQASVRTSPPLSRRSARPGLSREPVSRSNEHRIGFLSDGGHSERTSEPSATGESPSHLPHQYSMQHLAQNMARSSVIEYEIGILISRALDKVGDLVALNTERVKMHSIVAERHPQSFDMVEVHRELRRALAEAFADHKLSRGREEGEGEPMSAEVGSSVPKPSTHGGAVASPFRGQGCSEGGQATEARLAPHQLQELGAAFGRDPSALRPIVELMWLSGHCSPDLASVVTPPSPFMLAI